VFFLAVVMVTNLAVSALPTPVSAVTITILRAAAKRQYSMAVAPHSSSRNRASNRRIDKLLPTLPGILPRHIGKI
jgi:hypothetical protein